MFVNRYLPHCHAWMSASLSSCTYFFHKWQNQVILTNQDLLRPYHRIILHHCCGIIVDGNDTSYKRRIFLKSLYSTTYWNSYKNKTQSGVLAGIRAAVAISWDQKHKEAILNFKFLVVQFEQCENLLKF